MRYFALYLLALFPNVQACPTTLVCPREGNLINLTAFAGVENLTSTTAAAGDAFALPPPGVGMPPDVINTTIPIEDALALGCVTSILAQVASGFGLGNATAFGIGSSSFGHVNIKWRDTLIVNVVVELEAMLGIFTEFFARSFSSAQVDMAAFLHPKESHEVYEETGQIIIPYLAHPVSSRIFDEELGSLAQTFNNTVDFTNITEAKSEKFVFSRVPRGEYDLVICFVATAFAGVADNTIFEFMASSETQLSVRDSVISVKKRNPGNPCI